jgi:DNA (cytosine-5)-methyltransferase 1
VWLVRRYRHTEPPFAPYLRAYDLERGPCPIITADGIAGVNPSQYELVDERPAGAVVTATAREVARAEKPAYRVPTLEQIRAVPHNGLNVASLFAGAGGSSTGYRIAGYRVLAAVEFVPAAADTYQANAAPHTTVLRRDVRGLEPAELLDACGGLKPGELDLLDGSPPCEPFSTAGKRERTWNSVRDYSGQRQRTDDLFYEYARLVDGVRPRVFVAENVTGLARGRARGYFQRIMAALRGCGYRVAARTLDAAWLGVPQHRERIIIIGVRDDLDGDPVFPAPLPYQFTVRDAIGDLLDGGQARMGSFRRKHRPADITDAPAPTVVAGDSGYWHAELVKGGRAGGKRVDLAREPAPSVTTASGQFGAVPCHVEQVYEGHGFDEASRSIDEPAATVRAVGGGHGADLRFYLETGGRNQARRRDRADEPAPTITNGGDGDRAANSVHYQVEYDQQTVGNDAFEPNFGPLEAPHPTVTAEGARTSGELRSSATRVRRRFTIAELRRICGFPDDYVLTGSFGKQWERLGDAVPPPMAAAWARELAAGPLAPAADPA